MNQPLTNSTMTKQEEQSEIFKKIYSPEKPKKDGEYTCGNDIFSFEVNFMKGVWMCQNPIAIAWFYEPIEPQPPVEGDVRESFENLFKRHQEFSTKTFISSTPMSSLEGLKIEADEAIDELGGIDRDYDGEALPLEYVDCLMYLMDSIARAGIPLERIKEMFVKKLAINAERKWKINKNGSYSHIK